MRFGDTRVNSCAPRTQETVAPSPVSSCSGLSDTAPFAKRVAKHLPGGLERRCATASSSTTTSRGPRCLRVPLGRSIEESPASALDQILPRRHDIKRSGARETAPLAGRRCLALSVRCGIEAVCPPSGAWPFPWGCQRAGADRVRTL